MKHNYTKNDFLNDEIKLRTIAILLAKSYPLLPKNAKNQVALSIQLQESNLPTTIFCFCIIGEYFLGNEHSNWKYKHQ